MFDAMDLCVEEVRGDRTYYVVNPAIMYPAVIERMIEIKAGDLPVEVESELRPRAVPVWYNRITNIQDEAFDLALTPREQVDDDAILLGARQNALVLAWKFFKVVLRVSGATVHGNNNVLNMHLLNENAGEFDSEGVAIKSAFRYS